MASYLKSITRKFSKTQSPNPIAEKASFEYPGTIDRTEAENLAASPNTPKKPTMLNNLPTTPSSFQKPMQIELPSPILPTFDLPAGHFPPTPEETPEKQFYAGMKRSLPFEPQSPSAGRSTKRQATDSNTNTIETISMSSLFEKPTATPATSETTPINKEPKRRNTCNNPTSTIVYLDDCPVKLRQDRVSAIEVRRLADALLHDVDWDEVEDTVACNRPGLVYRKMIKNLLFKEATKREREEAEYDSTEESESSDDSDDTGSD